MWYHFQTILQFLASDRSWCVDKEKSIDIKFSWTGRVCATCHLRDGSFKKRERDGSFCYCCFDNDDGTLFKWVKV